MSYIQIYISGPLALYRGRHVSCKSGLLTKPLPLLSKPLPLLTKPLPVPTKPLPLLTKPLLY
jgi:hypothetical protein